MHEITTAQDILDQLTKTVILGQKLDTEDVQSSLKALGLPVVRCIAEPGLRVSLVHVKLPESGRVKDLRSCTEDLALRLEVSSVRVRTGVKKGWVTLEIAHDVVMGTKVSMGDVITHMPTDKALPWALGMAANGDPLLVDLADAPHVLIGGQTGSGKSSHLHSLVLSMSLLTTPHDVELVFIDPKRVDLYPLRGLPHVRRGVATTQAEAMATVRDIAAEVEFRFEELQHAGASDIASYNAWASKTEGEEPLRRIVLVIDELAMLLTGKDGQLMADELTALSQICRAAGVHLVASTQRPAASAIPTQLRSQLTTRVACRVATATDSRIILDAIGAEKLLGCGDTLVRWGGAEPMRVQGTYVSESWREWMVDMLDLLWVEDVPQEQPVRESNDVQRTSPTVPLQGLVKAQQGEGSDLFWPIAFTLLAIATGVWWIFS